MQHLADEVDGLAAQVDGKQDGRYQQEEPHARCTNLRTYPVAHVVTVHTAGDDVAIGERCATQETQCNGKPDEQE